MYQKEAMPVPHNGAQIDHEPDRLNDTPPFVIACGYRSIQSQKTSLLFPAWLLQLPNDNERYYHRQWRSKRDFLLLFRAAKCIHHQPPKAALEKLSNKAPWMNPTSHDNVNPGQSTSDPPSLPVAFIDNYHRSMKKSLLQIHRFLCACSRAEPLAGVWSEFCRPFDTVGLQLQKVAQHPSPSLAPSEPSSQESSQWGQYFCTEENASQLIHLTLHWLKKHDNKNVVFLEPSCGHGQIIWKLLEHVPLAEVIGFDLDNHAIHLCRQYYKNGENTIKWIQGDFLQSQPPWDWTEAKTVVCVGGPPYTLRKNNGNETTLDRDLPQLFLSHCLQTWHAEFCAFLLPRRYKSQALELPSNYECETHELMGSSTFLFQGKVEITQPSIIQTFFQVSLLNQCK